MTIIEKELFRDVYMQSIPAAFSSRRSFFVSSSFVNSGRLYVWHLASRIQLKLSLLNTTDRTISKV